MPGYYTHRNFNYIVLIIVTVLLYFHELYMPDYTQLIIFIVGYYIGTEFITPDLDIESKASKRWGLLRIIWIPYRKVFKHRGSSHNIFYGAIVRIIYISLIIIGIYYLIFKSIPSEFSFPPIFVAVFLLGIIIANALHIILDNMV